MDDFRGPIIFTFLPRRYWLIIQTCHTRYRDTKRPSGIAPGGPLLWALSFLTVSFGSWQTVNRTNSFFTHSSTVGRLLFTDHQPLTTQPCFLSSVICLCDLTHGEQKTDNPPFSGRNPMKSINLAVFIFAMLSVFGHFSANIPVGAGIKSAVPPHSLPA
jgi:hypothetical protein